jgi:tripartite-type tricarboxylate transporter receptor subunit TctC
MLLVVTGEAMMRSGTAVVVFGVMIAGVSGVALAADNFPARPLRFIVPFAPGGTTDILARVVGQGLAQSLGQGVVIDNRAGAGGVVGMELCARAQPDGHTLVMGYLGTLAILPAMSRKLPYDAIRDFEPITLAAHSAQAIAAHPSLPAKNAAELIALAKSRPLTYASAGVGSPSHLAGELFNTLGGVNLTHVPYKGSGAALSDLVGGQVHVSFGGLAAAAQLVKAGKLRLVAVTTAKRVASLPEVLTVAEAGIPGFEVTSWFGALAPARTPSRIVNRLHEEMGRTLRAGGVRERLAGEGAEVVANTPAEFAAYIASELKKWAPVVKAARIEMQ